MSEQIDMTSVGQRLRKLREERNLSLREVAERSTLSINAISRIERGEVSPTVNSLQRIAQALGLRLCDLFVQERTIRTIHTTPEERDIPLNWGVAVENLGLGATRRQLEAFIVTVDPLSGNQTTPSNHPGQEFVYCLQGRLNYQIGDQCHELTHGHSLFFDADQAHYFWNPSSEVTRFLLVFQSHIHPGIHT